MSEPKKHYSMGLFLLTVFKIILYAESKVALESLRNAGPDKKFDLLISAENDFR